jgi:hypothetical protein
MAYVGKGYNGVFKTAARIQVTEPGRGTYLNLAGKSYFQKTGAYYLYDNPNYHYYWVDSFVDKIFPNAVGIKAGGANSISGYIGRLQVDGQTHVTIAAPFLGLFLIGSDDVQRYAKSYQVLVCDPKPVNSCSKFQLFKIPNN